MVPSLFGVMLSTSLWSWSVQISSSVKISQILRVLSSEAVMTFLSSIRIAQSFIGEEWPRNCLILAIWV